MYYIPEQDIVNNTFILRCNNSDYFLDTELESLNTLNFSELLKISQKIKVFARRRRTKQRMISEIKRIITFEIPDGDYIQNF
jgi:hypothetical protein